MIHIMAKIIENLTEEETAVRNEIVDALRDSICIVTFIKSDGTERTMRCTLLPHHLPIQEDNSNKPSKTTKRTPMNIVAWDMDKGAWRSFNLKNIINWKREK
jgi:hypothetical protein